MSTPIGDQSMEPEGAREPTSAAESIRNTSAAALNSRDNELLDVLRDIGASLKRLDANIAANNGALTLAEPAASGIQEDREHTPHTRSHKNRRHVICSEQVRPLALNTRHAC
jgi:hypothetical protein